MKARQFGESENDFIELMSMYCALESEDKSSYLFKIVELLNMLNRSGAICFLFEVNNEIAGFSILYADNKGGCIGESLFIKPEYRGTKLFINILNFLKEYVNKNYPYCNLIASNENISNIYEKLGYSKKYIVYQYTGVSNG